MEEKKKLNVKIIILFLILVMTVIGLIINVNVTDPSIEYFTLTSGSIDYRLLGKYKITNKEEADMFYKIHGINFNDKYDLMDNTIFVQTESCGSGMMKLDFKRVKIEENVEFKYSVKTPFVALTQDMAYYYLVAIVPNEKLNGVNIDDWKSIVGIYNHYQYIGK